MYKSIVAGVASSLFSISAFASYFETTCPTCGPNFPSPGPTWVSAAVAFANAHSAGVGDTITVCKDRAGGASSFFDWWTVNSAPVTSSANLTYVGTGSDVDGPCNPQG